MRYPLLGLIWAGSIFGWSMVVARAVTSSPESTPLSAPAPADDAASDLTHEPAHAQSDAVKAFRQTAVSLGFPRNGLPLRGPVYQPAGYGPFPVMVGNQG